MKKLLIILTIAISGCKSHSPADFTQTVVITSVETSKYDNKICLYHCSPRVVSYGWTNEAWFVDVCGKFTVGDTIKLIKQ